MIEAPWCRVTGRVIGPDAAPHGVGGQVVFDPDPERVFAEVVEGEAPAIVATRVVCVLDEEGYITSSAGRFVDLVAPGPGVLPGGEWTYRMTVLSGSGQWASRMFEHVTLTQGAVVDLADLVPAATYQGDAVTVAEGAAQDAAASAEASASSAQAAASSAAAAEASASQAAADLATVRGEVQSGIHDGTGVVSITDEDGDGTATVTLTDGSTSDLILPRGPQGTGVASITNPDGDAQALVTLTDGTSQDLPLPTVAQPQFTAEASALAAGAAPTADVTGTYPDLTIALGVPEGAPGQDAVSPVFTAEASALAAGASATASVTGTYPDLKLSLGVPRGATGETGAPGAIGTASTYMLVGPGRPDVASTTGGVITGSEPVGAVFHSTNGAGVGAWAWQKTATGWTVTMGDTGDRSDSSVLTGTDGSAASGPWIKYRRVNRTVYLWIHSMSTTATPKITMPTGFAPKNIISGTGKTWGGAIFVAGTGNPFQFINQSGAVTSFYYGGNWATSDPWPTTLPGSPA